MDNGHLTLTMPGPSGLRSDMAHEFHQMLPSTPGLNFQPDTHAADKDPLSRWYLNDGPWHPLNSTSGAQGGSGQAMISNIHGGQLMGPSIINPQSDSGYGSHTNHPSAAYGSVCDDTQSTMGRSMADTQFTLTDATPRHASAPWNNHISAESNPLQCGECSRVMKTKSELKKHDQRHKKPFKCDIEGCTRQDGFSTVNDLDRHKRSVHPGSQAPGNRYVCSLGACKTKDKRWPRADNFRAHLKRVHKLQSVTDEELEKYVYKTENTPDTLDGPQDYRRQGTIQADYTNESPVLAKEQARSWSLPSLEAHHPPFLPALLNESNWSQSRHADEAPQQESCQEITIPSSTPHAATDSPASILDDEPHFEPEVSVSIAPPPVEEAATRATREHTAEAMATSMDVSHPELSDEGSEPSPRNFPAEIAPGYLRKTDGGPSNPIEVDDSSACDEPFSNLSIFGIDTSNTTELKKLVEALQNHGVLKHFGFKKDGLEAVVPAGMQDRPHACGNCPKTFTRKCELKKHAKRHEKPYACTMSGCDKKFGSKNDRKRHETTQHAGPKPCNCDKRKAGDSSEGCDKVCPRRGILGAHLGKDHQVTDRSKSEKGISQWNNSDPSHSRHLSIDDLDDGDDGSPLAINDEAKQSPRGDVARPSGHPNPKRKRDDSKSVGKTKKTKSVGPSAGGGFTLSGVICVSEKEKGLVSWPIATD
ncbi:hypothetical protein F4861DRAFT_423210 [Xylaria intraflava]|nr:hypothetical protein F4861DRAFT_423210 [Xylaria intraflava]